MRKTTAIIVGAALLAAAPAIAQTTGQGQTIVTKRAPDAAESNQSRTWDYVAGNWKRLKGSVRRQWGKLTHDDLDVAQGNREILAGKIQARYGIDKDKADKQLDAWLKGQK